jgi:hypothetical protein
MKELFNKDNGLGIWLSMGSGWASIETSIKFRKQKEWVYTSQKINYETMG